MSAKKSTLSAQPDSSEITAPPLTVITNPSPAATLSSAPSHQLSFSAPPSEAASSQVNASTVMQNDSQPTAPSDAVPSSSRGIVTPSALIPTTSQTTASPPTQPPSSSTPSSSRLPKESDYAETIMEAVMELDKENVDGDFSDLINYISRLLDEIEEKKKGKNQSMPKAAEGSCLASKNFLRLKDVVSEGVNAVIDMRPRKGQELKYPEYPKGAAVGIEKQLEKVIEPVEGGSDKKGAAVGIEKQLEKVIAMLEMESDKNAVAVIVHGVVGMAKTTLADAVFDAKREGYKYAKVRLFDDIASVPDVVKLQRCILTALMKGEESEIPEIRRYEEGQQVIEDMLEEEAAFIYIDNVLLPDKVEQGRDALRHLLPKNMRNARKLRLLLTTTDKDAVRIRGVKPVFYPIEGLPHEEARDSDPPFDVSKLKEFKKLSHLICKSEDLENLSEEKKKGKNQSMPKAAEGSCLASKNFLRLKDVVSEGVNAVIDMRPRKGQELKYPEYPKGAAVGIEKQLEKVIAMLEMESDKNAVAVIVHGVVGMAKTTLADAVFDAKREGYKYAKVRLFDDIASVPDVLKLQRCILTALMKGEESEIPEIRRYEEGQQVIEDMLEEEAAFIYIDNVLLPDKVEQGRDALRHLLPKNMRNARKLRLLLTTTDKDAVRIRGVKPVFYPIEGLPQEEARDSDPPFDVSKLKEFKKLSHLICKSEDLENLSEKDIVTVDGKTFLMGFLKGMGMAHMVTTGFLLAAYILERHEAVSENKEACLYLLREMNILADHVQQLQQLPTLKKRMEAPIRQATKLIVEASIDCCTQIGASSFFSATVNGEALAKFQKRLADTHSHMQDGMGLGQFDLFNHLEQGLSNEENLLKQIQSEFDSMLTNGEREPLNISGLPLNTLLLVMFDGRHYFAPRSFPFPLLEESIDDIQTHFEMVYFGNHFKKLPEKVADRIVGHAPADGDAKALFRKLLSLVVPDQKDFDRYLTSSFQMTAEIVTGEKGDKYLSRWKHFGNQNMLEDLSSFDTKPAIKLGSNLSRRKYFGDPKLEDLVVTKCGRYVKLRQLAERPGGSPIALLTELFRGGEEEISLSFLKNKDGESTKVGVDELKGKTILLDIRPANISFDIPLHALVEMYNVEKERINFEIITVPIMQEDTTLDVSEKFSSEVPWLVLQNPWQLTNATKYFLVEGYTWNPGWDRWYPNRMRIIESDGTIAPYRNPGVLRMVNTWGAAAYPFTAEKEEELIEKEKTQMEAMSHAMFLFQHLEGVAEQLREATGQQKMICLCCFHPKEFTNSMKKVLTELSDINYIIYIPNFHRGGLEYGYFTAAIHEKWYSLKAFRMLSAELRGIFSLSLSKYEALRFWARIRSLKEAIKATDQIQLREMLRIPEDELHNPTSWMFIMDEDGNLITIKGKEIVKLLSEKYSDDRVKELMQQLLEGAQTSRKKTLLELEEMV